MRNRRSERRREEAAANQRKKMVQPRSQLKTYDLLDEEKIEQIHDKSMQILEEAGIAFYYDPALEILRKHGVKVDSDRVAYFDREMVKEYLAKAPSQFTWSARNPENDVVIGGDYVCFAPVAGPPYVTDIVRGRRPSRHEDLINFLKLTQMSPYLHTSGSETVVSSDIPIEHRHLEVLYSHFTHSDKALMGIYHTGLTATDTLNMMRLVVGDRLDQQHYLHCIINVSSPRRLDDRMLSTLIAYASHNQIVNVTPFIFSGAMAPVSVLGSVAQLNAETLAGIVFTQMVKAGTPCVYGSFPAIVDLQSGAPVMSAPESQLVLYATAQLARHYKLPFRGAGNYASSKLNDAQGAYESMMSFGPSMISQPNFILHAAGWLESGLTAGYEKFVLDLDILGMYHTLFKGIDWDEDQWAMDAILQVPPGGHHLGTDHTMRHFKTAFYRSSLFDYDAGETWLANGGLDVSQRAQQKLSSLLNSYEKPYLAEDIKAALDDYLAMRKPQITPSMIVG
ncbi:MAG: trimethylamine methyltransferase family protein [Deinococcales bacterium]